MKIDMSYEETYLTKALGNSPTIRVIDLLIMGRGWDYSLSDIEEGAEVGWTTLHKVVPRLLGVEIIKHTRCVGRAKMYQINQKNPYAQMLIKLDKKLSDDNMERMIAEQETTARLSTSKTGRVSLPSPKTLQGNEKVAVKA